MSTTDREIAEFRTRLLSEIKGQQTGGSGGNILPDFAENVFTDLYSDRFSEIGLTENPVTCYFERSFGNQTAKVNGYAVSDDEATIDLFSTSYDGGEDMISLPPDNIRRAARQVIVFLNRTNARLLETLDPSSAGEYGMVQRLDAALKAAKRVRVFIVTDSRCSLSSIESEEQDGLDVVYEVIDVERMYRLMQGGLPRDEILVDFTKYIPRGLRCLHAPDISGDYEAYLALVPGELLYQLYDLYGPRLLEKNVRSFLQARGKVNRGIRDTLRKEPDRFMAYNNGIVVTADEIEVIHDQSSGARHIETMKGLQIVNGGQTTASIHRAKRDDKVDLSSVYVPAKISLIKETCLEEIVPKISLYANSQNNVQMADFSANDPFHVEMSRLSQHTWCPGEQSRWFYERTRGEYEVEKSRTARTPAQVKKFNERTPRNRKFDKVELAKFMLSWDQRPDKVSLGGQKCFAWFMQNLLETQRKDWSPDQVYYKRAVAKGILYKEAMKIVRQEKFPAYRAQVVTYVISFLSKTTGRQVDLDLIWERQSLSPELVNLLRTLSYQIRDTIVETSEGRNVTEWCKKVECWHKIRSLIADLPENLPPEITATAAGGGTEREPPKEGLSLEDLTAMQQCQALSPQEWIGISQWGNETGKLKSWQIGIASTLSGYAAAGWEHPPSIKQARHGVKIIKLAEEDDGPLSNGEIDQ